MDPQIIHPIVVSDCLLCRWSVGIKIRPPPSSSSSWNELVANIRVGGLQMVNFVPDETRFRNDVYGISGGYDRVRAGKIEWLISDAESLDSPFVFGNIPWVFK